MNFTPQELQFLHNMLDQVSVKGLESKQMVVTVMTKITEELSIDSKEIQDGSNN